MSKKFNHISILRLLKMPWWIENQGADWGAWGSTQTANVNWNDWFTLVMFNYSVVILQIIFLNLLSCFLHISYNWEAAQFWGTHWTGKPGRLALLLTNQKTWDEKKKKRLGMIPLTFLVHSYLVCHVVTYVYSKQIPLISIDRSQVSLYGD